MFCKQFGDILFGVHLILRIFCSRGGQPFEFTIGDDVMVQGFEEGIMGMCPGSRRKIIISPHFNYDDQVAGTLSVYSFFIIYILYPQSSM